MPEFVIFDLDGTLAESKQSLERHMADLLGKLLAQTKVAIVSGGALPQFLKQVVARLPKDTHFENLYLLPTSGGALYEWRAGGYDKVYEERISEADAEKIETAAREGAEMTGLVHFADPAWGERIEYRGSEVSISALGQDAPIAEKKAWDPDKSKRQALRGAIQERLPKGFTAAMGGATTVDITKEGVDKAYGIHQLSRRYDVPEERMLYVGDELIAGGNDEAAFKTSVHTHQVSDPCDTEQLILSLLSRRPGSST